MISEPKEQRRELLELARFIRKCGNRSSKSWAKAFEIAADATRKDDYYGHCMASALSIGLEKIELKETIK